MTLHDPALRELYDLKVRTACQRLVLATHADGIGICAM